MRYTNWSLTWDWQKTGTGKKRVRYIRRWAVHEDGTRKPERMPIQLYRHLRGDEEELKRFVIRQNHQDPDEEQARIETDIEWSFISPALLRAYFKYLKQRIPNKKNAVRNYGYLMHHVLRYFVRERKLKNPTSWVRHQVEWGTWLKTKKLSHFTIRQVAIEGNRFLSWMHTERPDEIKPLRLEPLTRDQIRSYRAERRLAGLDKESKYIPLSARRMIESKLNDKVLLAAFHLAYCLGLREAEVLGVQLDDVRQDFVFIERQLVALPKNGNPEFAPLKGKEPRTVEYWFATPAQVCEWVAIIQANLMTANTLCQRWAAMMKRLNMGYRFHDLRHAYTSDALDTFSPRQVQLSLGHKSIETTMLYAHKTGKTHSPRYVPTKAA